MEEEQLLGNIERYFTDPEGRYCRIGVFRQGAAVPWQFMEELLRRGVTYRETMFVELAGSGQALASDMGGELHEDFLRHTTITRVGCAPDLQTKASCKARLLGMKISGAEINIARIEVCTLPGFTGWRTKSDDLNAPKIHRKTLEFALKHRLDFEQAAFIRATGKLDRATGARTHIDADLRYLMMRTYTWMSNDIRQLTSDYMPGTYLVETGAPQGAIYACGKNRLPGSEGLWDAMNSSQHTEHLGTRPKQGDRKSFLSIRPGEGYWIIIDTHTDPPQIVCTHVVRMPDWLLMKAKAKVQKEMKRRDALINALRLMDDSSGSSNDNR